MKAKINIKNILYYLQEILGINYFTVSLSF